MDGQNVCFVFPSALSATLLIVNCHHILVFNSLLFRSMYEHHVETLLSPVASHPDGGLICGLLNRLDNSLLSSLGGEEGHTLSVVSHWNPR